jgi:oligoribonuclease NrnB/cAMP/cGMP phosphodiesterase (DHH superfamily)
MVMMTALIVLSVIEALVVVVLIKALWEWDKYRKNIGTPPKENADIKASDDLSELIRILREEKEEEIRMSKDKELAEYANKKLKNTPAGNIQSNIQNGEQPVHANTRGELVQFGMNKRDRAVLEEFYR